LIGKSKKVVLVTTTVLLLLLQLNISVIHAQRNVKLFPFGLSENDQMLLKTEDDNSSPEIRLNTPIVLYGQQHSSAYVCLVSTIIFRLFD